MTLPGISYLRRRLRGLSWLFVVAPGLLAAAPNVPIVMSCSVDAARANINELNDNNSGAFFDFAEIKVLHNDVDIAGWQLCAARDGVLQGCVDIGVGQGRWSDGMVSGADDSSASGDTTFMQDTWIVYDAAALRPYSNKGEAILIDSAGEVLDHVAWEGDADCDSQDYWSVPGDCSVCLTGKDASNKTLARMLPDGTGDWIDSNNDPTPEASNETQGASCDLGGFAVGQPASAIACPSTAAAITITALCSDLDTVKTDYTGTILLASDQSGSRFYDAQSGGNEIGNYSFTGDEEGQGTVYLYHPDEATVTVSVTDAAPDPDITGSGTATDFRAFGFKVDALATTLPSCSLSANYALTAFGQQEAGCGVMAGFSGVKNVKVWSEYLLPATNSHDTRVVLNDAVSLPTSESGSYGLTFSGGQAAFNLRYADAGRLKLHFKHDETPYDGAPYGAMEVETGSFDVVPVGFSVTASSAAGSLHGADAAATDKRVAGAPFAVRIQAQCADGTATPNYQPHSADLTLTQAMPAAGELQLGGAALVPGSGSQDVSPLFADGAIEDNTATYSEVGVLQVTVADSGYLGGVIPETTVNIGRFYPDHFRLSAPGLVNRSDLAGCSDTFTYRGETFQAGFTLVAENRANQTTENYDGAYARLATVGELGLAAQAGGADYSALLVEGSNPASIVWAAGLGAVRVDLALARGASVEAPVSDLAVGVAPVDGDGVALNFFDLDLDLDSVGDHAALGSLESRYGRVRVANAYGPETEPLGQPLTLQYYNGQGFVLNSEDGCTRFLPGELVFSDVEGALLSASLAVPSYSLPVVGGSAGLVYASPADSGEGPGAGNTGVIGLRVDLGGYPWLRFDWDGDGNQDDHDGEEDDPAGRATFGRYRGHDRVLFWKEPVAQ